MVGIVQRAGTVLRSSRSRLFLEPGDAERAAEALKEYDIEGLIVVGVDGSLTAASLLAGVGFPAVGIPKTIDNDVAGTRLTVGFQTAVQMAAHALDNLRSTAESHSRVMVVEVMGRSTGWIAVEAGIAAGADQVLIPERPLSLESIYDRLRVRHETHGRNYSILMVAEGFLDVEDELDPSSGSTDHLGRVRYAGVGAQLALRISADLGYNAHCTTLGYLQRCAAPIAADRILATRLSDRAYDLLQGGESGVMAGLVGDDIESVPLSRVAGETKTVPEELIALADVFG